MRYRSGEVPTALPVVQLSGRLAQVIDNISSIRNKKISRSAPLYDLPSFYDGDMAAETTPGEQIAITGRVFDGKNDAVDDAMIELFQANSDGTYAMSHDDPFVGIGRAGTGTHSERLFVFNTIKPGVVNGQAPHINVIVMLRGLLSHVYTRLYFSDEGDANSTDPVLSTVPESRLNTLIAQRKELPGKVIYEFDIHMQGELETVFLDI